MPTNTIRNVLFFQGVVALVKETKDDPMTRDEILGEIARLTKEMETLESQVRTRRSR